MCQKAFADLRRAVDEKHREAHRKIAELEEYLASSGGVGVVPTPGKPADKGNVPSEATTSRALVDRECAAWASVARIARKSGLSPEQVRGVLYDPHYKQRYDKRKTDGSPMRFKLKRTIEKVRERPR